MLEQLKTLDEQAQNLKTGCEMRSAELDNIRAIINIAGVFPDKLASTITHVQERLQELKLRPDWAGRHEQFKSLND